MEKQEIKAFIRQMEDLPTLPSVAAKIISTLLDEDSSARDVGEIVEADLSLTTKVLMVANSAFFGVPRGVSTVRQAIVSLGFKRLKSIILSLSVLDTVDAMAEGSELDPAEFWEHALVCAVCAEDLATKLGEEFAEEIFVAGLLHDIGKLILFRQAPEAFARVTEKVRGEGMGQVDAERSVLEMDHAQVGECLMDQWQFPEALKRCVGMHHEPPLEELDRDATGRMAAVICLADILSDVRGRAFSWGRSFAQGEEIRRQLGVSESEVEEIVNGLDDRVGQITEALGLERIPKESYPEILQKANAELGRMSLLLRESEERYRGIFESIQDVYVEVTMEEGKILEISPSIEALGGYRREQMLGKSLFSFFTHPRTHAKLLRALAENESVSEYEVTFVAREGREVPCSLSVKAVMDREGIPWKLIGTMRDITERKDAEERLRLQDRLAAVGQLAAGIAHDFNNLLTGIIGYAQLLQRREDMPKAARADLKRIVGQGGSAARLIRQILDFSRKSIIQRNPLNLEPFLRESIHFLKRTLPENIQIALHTEVHEYYVSADPAQIQQIITNLALNARDAMPEGGELRFQLSRLTLEAGEPPPLPEMCPGEWVVFSVSDTGTGIEPEHLSRIYEPFFTTKEIRQGTGLGLAQVYGIVMQHEGFIDARSEVGVGTEFTIYFAAVGDAESAEEEPEKELPHGRGKGVLVVEDHPEVLEMIRSMLVELGCRVLTAGSGEEALKIYDQHGGEIVMVLTDMVLTGMDGVELFHALRDRAPHVRVVVMTGYPLKEEEEEFLAQGIVAWVQKPVDLDRLIDLVRDILV